MQDHMSAGLRKLLGQAASCQISSVMPDGSPHIAQVWVDLEGDHIRFNSSEDAQKLKNIRRDPRIALNVVDPANIYRNAAIRGKVVGITSDGADAHVDGLARKYLGVDSYPYRQPGQVRVIVTIQPEKIHELRLD